MDFPEHLSLLEKDVISSADKDGYIPFPEGSAWEVNLKMQALTALEKRGLTCRKPRWNSCARGFCLTDTGINLRTHLDLLNAPFSKSRDADRAASDVKYAAHKH